MLITRPSFKNETIYNWINHSQIQNKPKDIWFWDIVSLVFIREGLISHTEVINDGWVWEVKETDKIVFVVTSYGNKKRVTTFINDGYQQ